MSALFAVSVWSQKPRTGFSDLKRRGSVSTGTLVAPPRQSDNVAKPVETEARMYDEDGAWQYTSFVNIGYVYDQTLKYSGSPVGFNGKWGAAVQVGNSYMWPRDAFFDILKFAVDATWFDFSGAQYEDVGYDHYQFTVGMGAGASLHLAPLANFADALRPLRIECYGRFVPSFAMLLKKSKFEEADDGDYENYPRAVAENKMKANGAFLPVVSFGLGVNYKAIGFGYEHRFGSATYKSLVEDGEDAKYDMTSDRIYISLRM